MEISNYFLVFVLNYNTSKGKELAQLMDILNPPIYLIRKEHLKGFNTKRRMQDFVEEYFSGLDAYKMLKPIS